MKIKDQEVRQLEFEERIKVGDYIEAFNRFNKIFFRVCEVTYGVVRASWEPMFGSDELPIENTGVMLKAEFNPYVDSFGCIIPLDLRLLAHNIYTVYRKI